MSEIRLDFGALSSGAQSIASTYASLQSLFDELQHAVNPVLANWDGAARGAYQGVQGSWNQLNQELGQALHQMGRGVDVANQNFQQAERRIASGFSGLGPQRRT